MDAALSDRLHKIALRALFGSDAVELADAEKVTRDWKVSYASLMSALREASEAAPIEPAVAHVVAGDTLVFRCEGVLSTEQHQRFEDRVQAKFGPDVKVLLLDRGTTFEAVVKPPEVVEAGAGFIGFGR